MLYLQTRSDSKSVEILEMAQNRSYKIEEGNMIEYENSSQLLKILDSKEFMESLKDNYHM